MSEINPEILPRLLELLRDDLKYAMKDIAKGLHDHACLPGDEYKCGPHCKVFVAKEVLK